MKFPKIRIKPTSRLTIVSHTVLILLMPLLVMGLVLSKFTLGAVMIVLLAKWRMFAVKPRYWVTNLKSNLVDIFVGLSVVTYLDRSGLRLNDSVQGASVAAFAMWGVAYAAWLVLLKPRSNSFAMTSQAFIAQGVALAALYTHFSGSNPTLIMAATWLICIGSARHFLAGLSIQNTRILSHVWGLFGAEMSLILGHWHLVYAQVLPQITLVLSIIGYALATGLYLDDKKILKSSIKTQLGVVSFCALLLIVVLSDWQFRGF
jgi:hypothetical protein